MGNHPLLGLRNGVFNSKRRGTLLQSVELREPVANSLRFIGPNVTHVQDQNYKKAIEMQRINEGINPRLPVLTSRLQLEVLIPLRRLWVFLMVSLLL